MGLKITNYSPAKLYPIDDAHPEEYDVVVYSDISGDDITGEELWIYHNQVCSEEEMIDAFKEDYVSYVDEEEYDEAKQFMIDNFDYKEEDFLSHPTLVKVEAPDGSDFEYVYELESYLNKNITEFIDKDYIYSVDIDDLEVEDDDYDPSDDYYDEWVDSHLE